MDHELVGDYRFWTETRGTLLINTAASLITEGERIMPTGWLDSGVRIISRYSVSDSRIHSVN